MEEKKYEFTGNTTVYNGITLHQIRAVKDFHMYGDKWDRCIKECNVYAGDIGGWISDEKCLSQYDNSWIHPSAKIIYSEVCGEVYIDKNTVVYDSVILSGRFSVFAGCGIFNHDIYCEDSFICDMQIGGKDNSPKSSKHDYELAAYVDARCSSSRSKLVLLDFRNFEGLFIPIVGIMIPFVEDATQYNKCLGKQYINASKDSNYKTLLRDINLRVDCHISRPEDILRIAGIGSRYDTVIFVKSYDKTHINVQTGCFKGTLDEFQEKLKKTHDDNSKFYYEYSKAIGLAKEHIELNV